jgi:enoyl-CoA hydratase/carnithine racemase
MTLNRSDKLSALNIALFMELKAHPEALVDQAINVGLVIVRGAGRYFSAGHDLRDIAEGEGLPRPSFEASVVEKLATLPQPVIAVRGHCYTGALEVVLASDTLICT